MVNLKGQSLDSNGKGKGEWFIVSEDGELPSFIAVTKVFYCKEDGEKLVIKSTAFFFVLESFLEKKAKGHKMPSKICSSSLLTALSDASIMMLVFLFE